MKCSTAVLFFLAVSGIQASASVIVYSGQDTGAGPGSPHPISSAAAANFDTAAAALGNVSIITFEGAPLGPYSSLTVAPGVSISGTNVNGANQSILNASNFPANPSLDGFNTTSGGTEFAEMVGGTLTFTFATPTQFFGAYFSGVQTFFFNDVVQFSDGTSETVNVPGTGTTGSLGALDFLGFTDAGKSISSITINTGNASAGWDDIGLDDVRFQSGPVATPEPSSLAFVLIGCLGLALGYRRFRVARI